MLEIRVAKENDYEKVREFYYIVTDALEHSPYSPGWIRDVYPTQEFLIETIGEQELYIGEMDGIIVACMVVNNEYNEGYNEIQWKTNADDSELLVIHALGVHPQFTGRGIAKDMVHYVIDMAKAAKKKSIRLDVLEGNLPAEKAYTNVGFEYLDTVKMFYEDTGWTGYQLYEYRV